MDPKTVVICIILNQLVFTVGIIILGFYRRKQFIGLSKWMIGYGMQLAGISLYMLREMRPFIIGIGLSNMIMYAGVIIVFIGIEEFVNQKSKPIYNILLLIGYSSALLFFIYRQNSLMMRRAILFLFFSIIYIRIAFLLLWRNKKKDLGGRLVGWASLCYVTLYVTNFICDVFIFPGERLFNLHPLQTALTLVVVPLFSFFSLGLYLLVIEKQTAMLQEDLVQIKKSEKMIEFSLKEKELLLKETHHRIKNNLQMVSSILAVKAMELPKSGGEHIMTDCQSRIQSMALIHELLYTSRTMSSVEIGSYSNMLIEAISISYEKKSSKKIDIKLDVDEIYFSPRAATIIGLILTEILTNSFKYAFPDNKTGTITLTLKEITKDKYNFIIKDNGIGYSADDKSKHLSEGFGLKLIHDLVENQLKGTIYIDSKEGTQFKISFPLPEIT